MGQVLRLLVMQRFSQTLRGIARNRRACFPILVCLTIGIGVSAAVVSIAHKVLLQPLAYPDFQDLVVPFRSSGWPSKGSETHFSLREYLQLRQECRTLLSLSAILGFTSEVVVDEDREKVGVGAITPDFFEMLGVREADVGRLFWMEDDEANGPRRIVLSHHFWKVRFGADDSILGKTVKFEKTDYEIVGVLPESFQEPSVLFPAPVDVWVMIQPLIGSQGKHGADNVTLRLLGRLRPDRTLEHFLREYRRVSSRIEHPPGLAVDGMARAVDRLSSRTNRALRPVILLLSIATGLLLVVSVANAANLFLARSTSRFPELRVRLSIGASKRKVAMDLLLEALLLSLAATGAALLLAAWGVRGFVNLSPIPVPRSGDIGIDSTTLASALLVALVAGCLIGAAPLTVVRHALASLLPGTGGEWSRRNRMRYAFFCAQISLTVILLIGSGLLAKSFFRLWTDEIGYDKNRISLFGFHQPTSTPTSMNVYTRLGNRLMQSLAVESIAFSSEVPLTGPRGLTGAFIRGNTRFSSNDEVTWSETYVSSGYFRTMGIEFIQGRNFDAQAYFLPEESAAVEGQANPKGEGPAAIEPAIFNETFFRRYWPDGGNPIDEQLTLGSHRVRIIGIVKDVRLTSVDELPPVQLYLPRRSGRQTQMVVRSAIPAALLAKIVALELRRIRTGLELSRYADIAELVSRSMSRYRFFAYLFGLLAVMALILAATGIYSIASFLVAAQRREIGVRKAFGATWQNILEQLGKPFLLLASLSTLAGVAATAGCAGYLRSLLWEVSPVDPWAYFTGAGIVIAMSTASCLWPTYRQSRLSPWTVLRCD